MRTLFFTVLIALFPLAALAETPSGPAAAVTAIYKVYQASSSTVPDIGKAYSARLQALIDADAKATPEGEVGKIDWDVFVDGQEWEISELKITIVSEKSGRAQVSASFLNMGEPREMLFDLVSEDGRWLVDDVQSLKPGGRWTMSKILTGAPDAFPDEAD